MAAAPAPPAASVAGKTVVARASGLQHQPGVDLHPGRRYSTSDGSSGSSGGSDPDTTGSNPATLPEVALS